MTTTLELADFFLKKGLKLGLTNMLKMDALFGYPSRTFQSIHVGGTNGKGSVSTKIAASLAGKVGLYTSPHISSYRERIKVDGEMIPEEELFRFVEVIKKEKIEATFFECMTMLAFLYFAEKKVDVAVIEVGLGGRWDATNIITPLLSIITSISLDHTLFLGDSIEKIAYEKAGIIKEEIPVLIGPKALPLSIFEKEAKEKKARLHVLREGSQDYEEENTMIAAKALELLPFESDRKGLQAKPPCRFERFEREIPIVLDVAHNPDGFEALFRKLGQQKIHLYLGLGSEKEIEKVLGVCVKHATCIHLVQSKNPKAATPDVLGNILSQVFDYKPFTKNITFEDARERALREKALLCVAGTFYIMNEIRRELGVFEVQDPILFSPY